MGRTAGRRHRAALDAAAGADAATTTLAAGRSPAATAAGADTTAWQLELDRAAGLGTDAVLVQVSSGGPGRDIAVLAVTGPRGRPVTAHLRGRPQRAALAGRPVTITGPRS